MERISSSRAAGSVQRRDADAPAADVVERLASGGGAAAATAACANSGASPCVARHHAESSRRTSSAVGCAPRLHSGRRGGTARPAQRVPS